ncbi:MAG: serine hydrolase [Hyphomonadaceae bacterium]|nr:serine hydrolase [Hyphomonadaceae bacterium]
MLRQAIMTLLFSLAAMGAAHAQLAPLPPQPPGVAWPTRGWEEAPLPADVDRAAFDLAITEAFAGPNEDLGETRALLIVQGGRIVFERYGDGYGPDTRLISWSMAKSITQALVGAAVLQGRVSIDAPMGSPHWRGADRRASISWRTWLTMTDGQRYHEIGAQSVLENGAAHLLYGEGAPDTARWAASLPLIHDPGTHWNYNSAASVLISDALTRTIVPNPRDANDRRVRMRAWMDQSLFNTIGMDPVVEFDPNGLFYGSSMIWADARDFAKFGYLYLRGGVWDGVRVAPEGWVDFARTPGPDADTDVYGAHWWITPCQGTGRPMRATVADPGLCDTFRAEGHEGQLIVVVPSKDMVLVRLGLFADSAERWNALGDWTARVINAFGDRG